MAKIGINLTTGSLQKKEIIVGIDLGTTNSLIAIIHPDSKQPTVLKEFDATSLVLTVIHFGVGGQISVGSDAKNFLVSDPYNTIFSVKRLMGKSYNDVAATSDLFSYKIIDDCTDDLVKIAVRNTFYTPIELSSVILKALKQRAEHILKTPINKAVITVPAYFNDAQRHAIRGAGRLAGLDVLRIINEPTAASLAYGIGLHPDEDKIVAVYDLGGGTFDISILKITNGIFEVLSINRDTYLGGDDFDNAIVRFWVQSLHIKDAQLKDDTSLKQQFRLFAEEAKKHLTVNEQYTNPWPGYTLSIIRQQFESLIQPFVDRTIERCSAALQDTELSIEKIDEVIMVGATTRVPLVQNSVRTFFNKALHADLNPDDVVALGAVVQADILAGNNKDLLLLDIMPLSLGIETMGGLMDVLIPHISKIPTKVGRQYTTQKDGQTGMRISVYRGERDLVRDKRKLAEFNLTGILSMSTGLPKVEISFLINADGILVVSAKELRNGVAQIIEIKPQYGLTDTEVEKMLLESIMHAEDDLQQRALVDAQTESYLLVETTRNFTHRNSDFLIAEECQKTEELIQALDAKIATESKNEIHKAIEELNTFSKPYVERLMDTAVSAVLKDQQL